MRVSTEKMVIYMPFDDNGNVAYDYSPARAANSDGVLSAGCSYTDDAILGHALRFEGANAECVVNSNRIDVEGEWTMAAFIKPGENTLSFIVNYSGQYLEHRHDVKAGEWIFVALERYFSDGYRIRAMVDTAIVMDEACLGTPLGMCICDDNTGEEVIIDEFKAWNRGLSLVELMQLQRFDDDVEYFINGKNFKTFGVEVSNSEGLLDFLKRKTPTEVDWPDYHGKVIDLNRPRYEAREITLECFITASNNVNFVMWLRRFMEEFQFKDGVLRLTCVYGTCAQPLVYDIYLDEQVDVNKKWNQQLMVGTFELHLVEPSPVKKVLRHISQTANNYATFRITTNRKISVTWGDHNATAAAAIACEVSTDGSNWTAKDKSTNISGTNLYVRHKYAVGGEYDIVIHGVIEKVTAFTTDDIVIWTRL